jgi:hypothetical protein
MTPPDDSSSARIAAVLAKRFDDAPLTHNSLAVDIPLPFEQIVNAMLHTPPREAKKKAVGG